MAPNFPAVGELYAKALLTFKDEIAVIDGDTQVTYSELKDRVGSTVAAFDSIGLRAGDSIGLGVNMCADFMALYIAAQVAGLTVVELSPFLPFDLLKHRITLPNVTVSFFRAVDWPEEIKGKLGELPCKRFSVGESDIAENFSEIVDKQSPVEIQCRNHTGAGAVIFTSGSTGLPKGIAMSPQSPSVQVLQTMATINHPVRPVCVLCMTHPTVMHMLMTPSLLRGGTVITMPTVDLEEMAAAAKKYKANFLFLPTRLLYALMDSGEAGWMKGQIELLYYGGENMTAERLREAIETCGPIFSQTYGMAETSPVSLLRPQDHDLNNPETLTSLGRPIVGCSIEIRDRDGSVVPPNRPGNMMLQTAAAMTEYIGQPEKTAETLVDGWVDTGDVGYKDENGYFYLLDREKFALTIDGNTIYPRMLELVIGKHPAVAATVALGVDVGLDRKQLCVAVQVRSNASVEEAELAAMVKEAYDVTPDKLLFLDELPMNPVSRKLDRPVLEDIFTRAYQ